MLLCCDDGLLCCRVVVLSLLVLFSCGVVVVWLLRYAVVMQVCVCGVGLWYCYS